MAASRVVCRTGLDHCIGNHRQRRVGLGLAQWSDLRLSNALVLPVGWRLQSRPSLRRRAAFGSDGRTSHGQLEADSRPATVVSHSDCIANDLSYANRILGHFRDPRWLRL